MAKRSSKRRSKSSSSRGSAASQGAAASQAVEAALEPRAATQLRLRSLSARAAEQARARALPKRLSDKELDKLSPEQVQAYKDRARGAALAPRTRAAKRSAGLGTIVAEGDSWFDFPVGTDLIDCLRSEHDLEIENFAKAGDTLENMIFGSQVDKKFNRQAPTIERVLNSIARIKPKVFLFSGGGNDVAGDELASFLNHNDSGLPPLRQEYVADLIDNVFRRYLEALIMKVRQAHPATKIVMHGYGQPIPTGQGVDILFFTFAGPWLKPALAQKGIPANQHQPLVRSLIDRYNATLARLQQSFPGIFHYVDLRAAISPSDWRDELHLKNSAYRRCAALIHQRLSSLA
jgi:lysophospholipase L1-like esterase